VARLNRYVVSTDLLQSRFGVSALNDELRERGLVKQTDGFSDGAVFLGRVSEPVLTPERVRVFRTDSCWSVPGRSFLPSHDLEAGPLRGNPVVQR